MGVAHAAHLRRATCGPGAIGHRGRLPIDLGAALCGGPNISSGASLYLVPRGILSCFLEDSASMGSIGETVVGKAGLQVHKIGAPIPVLSLEEVAGRLKSNLHEAAASYKAMYSSVVGGFTTDPAAMVMPLDDHMAHRGHAVFDTALIWEGYLYELDPHLDRALRSASKAKVVPPYPREELRRILIELAAVSGVRGGSIRYWLSAGPGSFNLSMSECVGSSFYAVVIADADHLDHIKPQKVITSSIPIKPPQFATVKSTNYLPNALVIAEANERGADTGIWLDENGYIAEGPNLNVGFVTKDNVMLVPEFDRILSGCTAKRMLALAPGLLNGPNPVLTDIQVRKISVEEARGAAEMCLIGSGVLVMPVVEWDGQPVGTGQPGPVVAALRQIMIRDRDSAEAPQRLMVEYGSH